MRHQIDSAPATRLALNNDSARLVLEQQGAADVFALETLDDYAGVPLTDYAGQPLTGYGALVRRGYDIVIRQRDC